MKQELVGRERELAELPPFLDDVERAAASLVFEGDPGIGKTALFDAAVAQARHRGILVLEARPAESEASMPYAALGDLVGGHMDVAETLPDPQRRALDVAMLRANPGAEATDRRAVSLSVLGILERLATERPLLLAFDDLQWVDSASATPLAFALRRVGDARVGFLATSRPQQRGAPAELAEALPEERRRRLKVGALDRTALAAMLASHLHTALPAPVVLRIHRVSGGNPFLALELARALAEHPTAVRAGDPFPVPLNLRDLVRDRLERMSPGARSASLIVAALPQPSVERVEAALAAMGEPTGLDDALAAGVVDIEGGRCRFTHPLLGSIVYSETSPAGRRALHAQLASLAEDVEERARHLAAATTTQDERVASLLERSADRAVRRGAPDAAAELLERAAALTEPADLTAMNDRLLAAAERHFEAGATERARDLFERIAGAAPDEAVRLTAGGRLGLTRLLTGDLAGASAAFERALRETVDAASVPCGLEEGLAWTWESRGDSRLAVRHARAAVARAKAQGDLPGLATALASTALFESRTGIRTALKRIEQALALPVARDELRLGRSAPERIHAQILMGLGEVMRALMLLRELHEHALERGSEGALAIILPTLSLAEIRAGLWDEARVHAREAYLSTLGTGQLSQRLFSLATVAQLAALRGDADEARARVHESRELTAQTDFDLLLANAQPVLGMLELSLGDAESAAATFRPLDEQIASDSVGESGWFRFLADEIEALVALGDVDAATSALAKLEARRNVLLDRAWTAQALLRCRGMLAAVAGDAEAGLHDLIAAVRRCEQGEEPYELARSLLALGRVQRRLKQRANARDSLARADDVFARLGAPLWRERVAEEATRIGGRPARAQGLTPTERHVAELAAGGLTNREIAAAAFLSVNTVQTYLKRIYRELGVRSRTELARAIAPAGSVEED